MLPQDEAAAHVANFVTVALIDLVHCLKNQGAIEARQYENALRTTIEHPDAPRERLDYVFLAELLRQLEKREPGKSPEIDAIH